MRVDMLWRYPVKSLAGEPLAAAELTADGLRGDRTVHVAGTRGPLTGRTRHGLLTLRTTTGVDGEPLVEGHPWRSPAAARLVRERAGPAAELVGYGGPERFDIGTLLVALDGELDAYAAAHGTPLDVRRLRPNLVLGGASAARIDDWPGRVLAVGEARIGVYARRGRCIVTSIDPDTGAQDLDVFRRIRREHGGLMALDCWVLTPGRVRLGDPARLEPDPVPRPALGGWILGAPYRVGA